MKFQEIFEAIESLDLTPFYLLFISVGTILYSCANSIKVLFGSIPQERRPSLLQATEEAQEEITFKMFAFMLLGASATLLILYYILDSIILVLKCILTFSCFVTLSFVLWDFFYLLLRSNITTYLTYGFSLFLCIFWFITENWLVTNLLAFCMCVSGISLIKIGRFQVVLAVAIGFLIYDVWWVFLSPKVFGKSVMVEAATGMSNHVPAMFTIPKTLSEKSTLIDMGIYSPLYTLGRGNNDSNKIDKIRLVNIPIYIEKYFSKIKDVSLLLRRSSESLIGAGDIVIPGIVLDFFLRFDIMNYNLNIKSNLFIFAFGGYFVGVALSWIMVNVMQKGQPALLWIFPSVLIPTTIRAFHISVLKILWSRGAPISNSAENSSNSGNIQHDQNDEQQELQDIQDLQGNENKENLNIDENIDLSKTNAETPSNNDTSIDDNTELNANNHSNVNRYDIMKEIHRQKEPQDVKVESNEEEDKKE